MTNTETNDTAATAGPLGAPVAPDKSASKEGARQEKRAPKRQKSAKGGQTKTPPRTQPSRRKRSAQPDRTKKATPPRAESKTARILALIGRPKGASMAEIRKAIGWQAHSVRGFLSTATKKHGLKIESAKSESGDRIYKIVK